MTPSAKPFFPNVNLRAIHAELKRQTVEIRQCSPPSPRKKWDAVYLQQIWWIARMDPFTGKGIVQYFVSIVYPTDKLRTRRWDLRALPA